MHEDRNVTESPPPDVPGDDAVGTDAEPASDPAAAGTAPRPTGRGNAHLRKTVGDMVRSMAVVLALVFVIVLLAWRPLPDAVTEIDASPVVARAALQADFTVLDPSGLPESWRATSARWETTAESGDSLVLHVGYVTPSDEYAQISESRAASERYLGEQTSAGAPVGTREVAGQVWQEWESPDRSSLVLIDGGVTTVVSGTGGWDELESLVRALTPVAG